MDIAVLAVAADAANRNADRTGNRPLARQRRGVRRAKGRRRQNIERRYGDNSLILQEFLGRSPRAAFFMRLILEYG